MKIKPAHIHPSQYEERLIWGSFLQLLLWTICHRFLSSIEKVVENKTSGRPGNAHLSKLSLAGGRRSGVGGTAGIRLSWPSSIRKRLELIVALRALALWLLVVFFSPVND